MFGIDILYTEHDHVVRFTHYLRKLCKKMLAGENPNRDTWLACVEFIKIYADAHHHGKEEEILFTVMLEKLGAPAQKMINTGMLVEHNLARYHTQSLEEAAQALSDEATMEEKVNLITHALAYADLLQRHAYKENQVLFPFAKRNLSAEDLERVNKASKVFEEKGAEKGMEKYVDWLMQVQPEEN